MLSVMSPDCIPMIVIDLSFAHVDVQPKNGIGNLFIVDEGKFNSINGAGKGMPFGESRLNLRRKRSN